MEQPPLSEKPVLRPIKIICQGNAEKGNPLGHVYKIELYTVDPKGVKHLQN